MYQEVITYLILIEFTKWDKINVKGPMTMEQLKKHFESEEYKI